MGTHVCMYIPYPVTVRLILVQYLGNLRGRGCVETVVATNSVLDDQGPRVQPPNLPIAPRCGQKFYGGKHDIMV